jgi:DNA-binding PadR family transcriptional regulator
MRTLPSFLRQVERLAPVNLTALREGRRSGYGILSRYIRFCLEHGLIWVIEERYGRGRYPSRYYDINEKGRRLLKIFEVRTLKKWRHEMIWKTYESDESGEQPSFTDHRT